MTHPLLLAVLLTLQSGEATFHPTPDEARVPELFQLPESTFSFELEQVLDTPGYSVARLRFPSPVVTPDPANNTVHGEYFRPKVEGRRPAVVVLHILGADFALSRYYAARLADRGVAALFLKLPYYGERRGPGDQKFLSTDVGRSTLAMRQGVADIRRGSAWLASRPEVDATKLGVTGISLGGITSALAVAIDPVLNRGVFLLAGGGLDEILWQMDEPEARQYRKMWLASGRTREDLTAITRPLDPLTYADRLKSKKILMMAGNIDEVVPPSSARALWEAAGRPPIRWFDCGHYSSAGYLLPAIREAVEFLAGDSPR
ncbi:alpha/beta hydrolase family protein [Tundrisphaera lichenicola]|uniref:alpha/beta hydrolase family protein n=1 Tax=Tundrisphaera lichenicola TaxID=2029860 RepID=UPI003EB960E7